MWEIIKTGIILMLYTLVAGALLAFVYIKTAPILESNKIAATDAIKVEVLPDMADGYELQGEGSEFPYWIGYRNIRKKEPGGYIFIARKKGYSSTIETMVGVDVDGIITGVKILFQQETPGLGDKIEEIRHGESDPWFPRQFLGKSAFINIKVTKDGGDIDAISGATISSSAVTESINIGLKRLMAILDGETFAQIAESAETPHITAQPEEETDEEPARIPPEEAITEVLPDMAGGYELQGEGSDFSYWIGYRDSEKSIPGGYVFIAIGEGFASTIEIMVGVSVNGTIVGTKVLFNEEPPGYGDKIEEIREGETDPWFTSQFLGKSTSNNIALIEDDGDIDAISEATITSRAITDSINIGLKRLMEILEDSTQ